LILLGATPSQGTSEQGVGFTHRSWEPNEATRGARRSFDSGDESMCPLLSIPHDEFGNFNSNLKRSTQDLMDGSKAASRGISMCGGRRQWCLAKGPGASRLVHICMRRWTRVTNPGSDEIATIPRRLARAGHSSSADFQARMEEEGALRRRSHARGQESARWGPHASVWWRKEELGWRAGEPAQFILVKQNVSHKYNTSNRLRECLVYRD
jgi:hypothetical protein